MNIGSGCRRSGVQLLHFFEETGTLGRMRVIASQMIVAEQRQLTITVSLGIAAMQGSALDLAALLTQAEQALYAAKRAGRNCIRLAEEQQFSK